MLKGVKVQRLVALLIGFTIVLFNFFSVHAATLTPQMWIECPTMNAELFKNDIHVSGWALNPSGISKVNVYLDNELLGQASTGIDRPDVNSSFPGYPDGSKSGFDYIISINKITAGNHSITVEPVGKDGTTQKSSRTINFKKTPLIGQATATQNQAEVWAKSKNATDTFISLAEKYWRLASSRGGLNPAVAYAQAAKETGFGKFGGVIDESYKNPCGLKTTNGGDNTDPNAHQKFADWEQGVTAHLDHLALYAGAKGYPRTDTPDPRHFPYLAGKAPSVESLGGSWAPSSSYGEEVVNLQRQIENTKGSVPPRMRIETPNSGTKVNNNFAIYGWALNPSGVKQANVLVNDKVIGQAQLRQDRKDVNNAFPGYPNASSFTYEFNINQFPAGVCSVSVQIIGNDGSTDLRYVNVNIDKPLPRMNIETPNSGIKTSQNVAIYGWALNVSGVKDANIKVDGTIIGKPSINKDRPDVNGAFPGYPNAVSFTYELNIDSLDTGYRNVTVEIIGNDGSVDSRTVGIDVNKLKPKTWIESLGASVKTSQVTKIYGWAINPTGVNSANIILDDKVIGQATIRNDRPDVSKAYSNYPSAASFDYNLDVSKYPLGNHTLKVEVVGNDGSKDIRSVDLTILKEMRAWIEHPYSNALVKSKFTVTGWVLSSSNISNISVYVDGKFKGTGLISGDRPDVNNSIPGYPMGKGFEYTVDISSEIPGPHAVTVEITNQDGDKISKNTLITKNIVYAIDIGHNVVNDGGATYKVPNGALRVEDTYNMAVGTRVISILEGMGYEVVNVLPKSATSWQDSCKQRANKANAANVDMYVSIHFNSGGGTGSEVYYVSDEGKKIAQSVLNNIVALGYKNRGVKNNDYNVLVDSNAPAILIESGFIDSDEDMNRYNPDDLAKAIVNGIKR